MGKKKSAGRRTQSGNVVLDLGEQAYRAGPRTAMSGPARSPLSGGYRPGGLSSGIRPWYQQDRWALGQRMGIPEQLVTSEALTGALIGTAGNRVVVRLVPSILGTSSRLLAEAVAFGVGLIPFLVQRNSWTTGAAIPGLVFLTGALADFALDSVGLPRPVLAGLGESRRAIGAMEAALAARQKLAALSQQVRPAGVPRVGYPSPAYAHQG